MASPAERPAVIAHRGASSRAPEHTVAAYDLALMAGADVLEVDVRLTGAGELAIVHDTTLLRTAGDPRAVSEIALADLDPSVRPLSLGELLGRYGSATRYLLDLKDPCAPVERRVAEEVERHGLAPRVQIQTFCKRGLRRAHRAAPGVSLAQLYPEVVPRAAILRDLARVAPFAAAIGPEAHAVDAALVAAAHARGLRVQPYTVNDPAEVERLLALGVDGVISDVPDVVRGCVDAVERLPLAA